MKKTMLKKLMCAVLTAVCVATAVVPAMADDVITAEAATKKVTSAYKYHLEGYDKNGYPVSGFSKTSFYKDLNSLPAVKTGKTTINVPAVTSSVKSVSKEKGNPEYESYVKFKAQKTGKYVFTIDNLQGTDDKSLKCLNIYICRIAKNGKKYFWKMIFTQTPLVITEIFTKTITLQGSAQSSTTIKKNIRNTPMSLRKRTNIKRTL